MAPHFYSIAFLFVFLPWISTPVPHIVGARDAKPHSIPWIAELRSDGQGHQCGGSILRIGTEKESDVVTTAGHCFDDIPFESYEVRLGSHLLSKRVKGEQHRRIKKVVLHPAYKKMPGNYSINDIAIIKLNAKVRFSKTIKPIRLPDEHDNLEKGTKLMVAGWGYLSSDAPMPSEVLQIVQVPIVRLASCNKSCDGHISNQMLCAGYKKGGKDSCSGDSGGPLFSNGTEGAVLHGLVCWGHGCAFPRYPGVYVHVNSYIDWIETQLEELAIEK